MTPVDLPEVAEVLGVAILPNDHLRVSGLDQDCEAINVDSTDSGQTWQLPTAAPAGIWRLAERHHRRPGDRPGRRTSCSTACP